MKLPAAAAGLAVILFASTVQAAPAGWWVKTRDGECVTDRLTALAARSRDARMDALDKAAQSDPSAVEFKVRKSGGFLGQGVFHDMDDVESIVFTEVDASTRGRPQRYRVSTVSGHTFDFDDNFGAMYLCPKGVAPPTGTAPESCGSVFYVKLVCERLDNGQVGALHLRFDSNGNGRVPPGPSTQLLELRRIDEALLAQRRHEAEQARAVAARQLEQSRATARADAAAAAALRQQQLEKTASALRAPVGTSVFCSSGAELLLPGDSLGDLAVRCDGMPTTVSVRDLTGAGWSVVNQVNSSAPSASGRVGTAVSFQAVKSR